MQLAERAAADPTAFPTMNNPTPSGGCDPHPVELLILAVLLVAAALAELVSASRALLRKRPPAPPIVQPLAADRPAAGVQHPDLDSLNVQQLRALARLRLGSGARIGGRRIAQARRADLLGALS